jgi:hypothetical protein
MSARLLKPSPAHCRARERDRRASMDHIGPYRILGEPQPGGMALVYPAIQPSLNRRLALKILLSHLQADANFVARFRREATIAAALHHEHIVHVYDAHLADPPYYIAMEFLEGGTLATRLAPGPLAVDQAIDIATRICSALSYAHRQGVVHRDVKPSNIMFDERGRPLLTDFGIARALEGTVLTETGARLGSAPYMSPEQVRGLPVDARTDIFSLGAVLYEMTAGHAPFGTDNPAAVTHRILTEDPLPPSQQKPGLTHHLDRVIMRALAKDPSKRFQTCDEMAAALAGSQPPQRDRTHLAAARPDQRPVPPRVRRRVWPLIASAGLLALLGGAYVGLHTLPRARSQTPVAGSVAAPPVAKRESASRSSVPPPSTPRAVRGDEIVRDIADRLPEGMWLTEVSSPDTTRITLTGLAWSQDLVGQAMESLSQSPYLSNVVLDSLTKDDQYAPGRVVNRVRITADLRQGMVLSPDERDQLSSLTPSAAATGRPPSAHVSDSGPGSRSPAVSRQAPSAGAGHASPGTGAAARNHQPAQPQQEPPVSSQGTAAISLAGITMGEHPMAILRLGDQRWYAKAGDQVGGYRVQSIGREEVVLAGPDGTLVLRLARSN